MLRIACLRKAMKDADGLLWMKPLEYILCINGALGPIGLRAFGAIGDLGLSMFWSLGQMSLWMVGMKGPFEALGQMAYMGFSTFGVL